MNPRIGTVVATDDHKLILTVTKADKGATMTVHRMRRRSHGTEKPA